MRDSPVALKMSVSPVALKMSVSPVGCSPKAKANGSGERNENAARPGGGRRLSDRGLFAEGESEWKCAGAERVACGHLPRSGKAMRKREPIQGPGTAVPGTPILARERSVWPAATCREAAKRRAGVSQYKGRVRQYPARRYWRGSETRTPPGRAAMRPAQSPLSGAWGGKLMPPFVLRAAAPDSLAIDDNAAFPQACPSALHCRRGARATGLAPCG